MSGQIKIGWAGRDITPLRPVSLRGLFNLRISKRVRDPLTLTALALDSGDQQVVLVSLDSCGADDEVLQAARERLQELLPELPSENLIASATHTHTAPFAGSTLGLQKDTEYLEDIRAVYPDYMTTAEYNEMLVAALVEAVCEAWQKRRPGSLGYGYSYAVVGENRRVRYFDDRAQMYGATNAPDFSHIEGHVDHTVSLLFTYDVAQQLTGAVVNVACPSQASEGGQDYVSADYWHDTREELRRRHGSGLFVLPQCSAAGDQSPHRQVGRKAEDRMMRLKYDSPLNNSDNHGLRQDIARRLATAFDEAEPAACKDLQSEVVLAHERLQLDLPHWNVTEAEYASLQEQVADLRRQLEELGESDRLGAHYTSLQSKIAWCQRAASRYEQPLPSVPVEVHVVRLGDIAFVTSPFEYYLDFGDRIKGRSPAVQTFVVQLAGGGSYLATERAASGLSYGAVPASCRVSPAGGQVIVEEALGVLERMFAEE
jgi:hypothetical protein